MNVSYSSSVSSEGALAAAIAFLGFFSVLLFAILVLSIVVNALIFRKMGKPWWHAIIPVYNIYSMDESIQPDKWFSITDSVLPIILGLLSGAISATATVVSNAGVVEVTSISPGLLLFTSLVSLVATVFSAIRVYTLCRVFGKSTGFCIFSIFFPFIAMLILAFGKDNLFIGKLPCHFWEGSRAVGIDQPVGYPATPNNPSDGYVSNVPNVNITYGPADKPVQNGSADVVVNAPAHFSNNSADSVTGSDGIDLD